MHDQLAETRTRSPGKRHTTLSDLQVGCACVLLPTRADKRGARAHTDPARRGRVVAQQGSVRLDATTPPAVRSRLLFVGHEGRCGK